jgi:quinol-cytochrome oxidoreductase complex cytochrome b subunit
MKYKLFVVLALFSAICLITGYMLSRDQMSAWALLAFILSSWFALSFGFMVGLFGAR